MCYNPRTFNLPIMSKENITNSNTPILNKDVDWWARKLLAAKETQSLTPDELKSEDRRRFLRNSGRVVTKILGAAAMWYGSDYVGRFCKLLPARKYFNFSLIKRAKHLADERLNRL